MVKCFGWIKTDQNTTEVERSKSPLIRSIRRLSFLSHSAINKNTLKRAQHFSAYQLHCANHWYGHHKHTYAHLASSFQMENIHLYIITMYRFWYWAKLKPKDKEWWLSRGNNYQVEMILQSISPAGADSLTDYDTDCFCSHHGVSKETMTKPSAT